MSLIGPNGMLEYRVFGQVCKYAFVHSPAEREDWSANKEVGAANVPHTLEGFEPMFTIFLQQNVSDDLY
jgi:hypothetical protein